MTTPDELRELADRMDAEKKPEQSALEQVNESVIQTITRLRGGCFEYEPMRIYRENRRPKSNADRA
jgi:hypothetical protein